MTARVPGHPYLWMCNERSWRHFKDGKLVFEPDWEIMCFRSSESTPKSNERRYTYDQFRAEAHFVDWLMLPDMGNVCIFGLYKEIENERDS